MPASVSQPTTLQPTASERRLTAPAPHKLTPGFADLLRRAGGHPSAALAVPELRTPLPERMPAGRPSGEAMTPGRHLSDAEQQWARPTPAHTQGERSPKETEPEPPRQSGQEPQPRVLDVQPELVDPMLTLLARPPSGVESVPTPSAAPQLPSELLDQLAARIVRRCSVGRDGDASTVRLEFGEGRFEGASVLVQSERGRVSVRIAGSEPEQRRALQGALRSRLAARGVSADDVTVD